MRIAILGCGSIGRRHLANVRTLGHEEIVAFDPDANARESVAADGVSTTGNLDEVWKHNPRVVFVMAPSNLHVTLASEALARGCDLFIEKPLSHTLDGLAALAAEAERRKLVTMVGCNMRFHPGPAAVKRWIDAGAIGDVLAMRIQTGSYLPRWRPWQDYRESYSASPEWGGAILDCIHELDLALWFAGPATLVSAATLPARAIGIDTEGLAEILLRHDGGALSNVHLNFIQRDYRRNCQIIGSEGTLDWDFTEQRVRRFGPDGEPAEELHQPEGWQLNDMYVDELRHFFEAVATRRPAMNPIAEAERTLRLALAARARGAG